MPAPTSKHLRPVPLRDLKDLRAVKRQIESQARLEQERIATQLAAKLESKAGKELFSRTIGPVKALPAKHLPGHKTSLELAPPAPIASISKTISGACCLQRWAMC